MDIDNNGYTNYGTSLLLAAAAAGYRYNYIFIYSADAHLQIAVELPSIGVAAAELH